MKKVWDDHEHSSPAQADYERSLAEQLRETGCAAKGAPYVLSGLLRRLSESDIDLRRKSWRKILLHRPAPLQYPTPSPFDQHSPEAPKLAATYLDKDCAGARGLSEADIAKLEDIRDSAPPPAPKQ